MIWCVIVQAWVLRAHKKAERTINTSLNEKHTTGCKTNVADCCLSSHPPRKCSTESVNLWSASTSWDTTPTHPAIIPQSSRSHQGVAAASGGLVPNVSGMFRSMAKAGHAEALKPEAQIKPHFFCLGCWGTRTMKWCGS